jgi:hypothetical protein
MIVAERLVAVGAEVDLATVELDVPEPARGAEERLRIVRHVRSLPGHGWAGGSAASPPDGGPWGETSLTNFSDNRCQTTRTRRKSFAVKCPP